MGIFKGIRGAMGGVDKKLLESGILARGLVIDCHATAYSTGNTVAGTRQVCKVTVEISGVPGRPSYRATCLFPIPVLYLAQMKTPGATVAVRVDPDDPQDIALDLETSPPPSSIETDGPSSQVTAQTDVRSGFAESTGPEVTNHPSDIKGPEILARGVACRVIVVESMPLGQLDSQGMPATGFVLSVFVSGRSPYQVQIGMGVPPEAVPLVFPGANLPAKVLSDRPDLVSIDWPAALEAAKSGPPV